MEVDPGNKLLWKMRLRRLESEIIRDSILEVSGNLDRTIAGPPLLIEGRTDGKVVISDKSELKYGSLIQNVGVTLSNPSSRNRRSLYVLGRRNYNLSILSVFDQPVMATNCTRRSHSAVVQQSLAMLNSEFVLDQAREFANRVKREAGTPLGEQIELAFRLALARKPSLREME